MLGVYAVSTTCIHNHTHKFTAVLQLKRLLTQINTNNPSTSICFHHARQHSHTFTQCQPRYTLTTTVRTTEHVHCIVFVIYCASKFVYVSMQFRYTITDEYCTMHKMHTVVSTVTYHHYQIMNRNHRIYGTCQS